MMVEPTSPLSSPLSFCFASGSFGLWKEGEDGDRGHCLQPRDISAEDHKSIVIAEKGRRKLARLKAALRWRRGGVAHILRIFIIIFTQSDLYGTHRAQWPRNKGIKLGYIYKISTNLGKHNTRWYHMAIKR